MSFNPLSCTLTGLWVLLFGGVLLAYALSRSLPPALSGTRPTAPKLLPMATTGEVTKAIDLRSVEKQVELVEAKKERVLLQARFERAEQDLGEMAKDKDVLKDAMEDAQAEAERMNIINRYLLAQLKALQSSHKLAQDQIVAAKSALDRSELARTQLQVRLNTIEAQLEQAQESLQTRTDELDAARVLLRTQDLFAGAKLDGLDIVIARLAESLAAAVERGIQDDSRSVDTDDTLEAADAFRRWFSSPTLDDLRSVSHADPSLLSTIFRACLGHMAAFIITRSSVPTQFTFDKLGKPADEMAGAYVDDMLDMLACVVLAARLDGDRAHVRTIVHDHAYGGVREVVEAALRINRAIGDAVTSGVVSPLLAHAGAVSDEQGVRGLLGGSAGIGMKRDGLEGKLFGEDGGFKSKVALQML